MSNIIKYPAFIISGLIGTVFLTIVSQLVGFSRENFLPFAGPYYAGWVYPVYFFISFMIFAKVFQLPKIAKYYIIAASVIFAILLYFIFEGQMFDNPIPFGIGAV